MRGPSFLAISYTFLSPRRMAAYEKLPTHDSIQETSARQLAGMFIV